MFGQKSALPASMPAPHARPEAANEVRFGYANTQAGQIHYREVAGDAPPVVFLHQTASSSGSFHKVLQRLRLPNRLVALDTPGFGGSFNPSGWPTMAKYAAWVMAALDDLGIGKAHFFGQHTGASLALEIAHRHRSRTASVMLLGPVPMSLEERVEFRAGFSQPIRPRADGSHLVENWKYAHDNNVGCDLEIIHGEVVSMARAWKGRPQAYRAVSFHDSIGLLRKVKGPMLLMSAPGDYFFKRFRGVCDLRPDAEVSIVGGDNFPPLVDPSGVARGIERFVGRIAAG